MRRARNKHAERLRLIVDTLPYETRVAMLEGLKQYDIIAGAYSNRDGGVCPMLAAHRCGGRTDLRSFARAWDRFTGAGRARRASERELRTLAAQLESSLWREDQARYAHRAEVERLEPATQPTVEEATTELAETGAWLLPYRDLEEYARALRHALAQFEDAPSEADRESQLVS
jgi:hypothetical protein